MCRLVLQAAPHVLEIHTQEKGTIIFQKTLFGQEVGYVGHTIEENTLGGDSAELTKLLQDRTTAAYVIVFENPWWVMWSVSHNKKSLRMISQVLRTEAAFWMADFHAWSGNEADVDSSPMWDYRDIAETRVLLW